MTSTHNTGFTCSIIVHGPPTAIRVKSVYRVGTALYAGWFIAAAQPSSNQWHLLRIYYYTLTNAHMHIDRQKLRRYPLRTHGSRTHCGIVTTLYLLSCRGSSSIPASLLQYLGADREQDPRSGNFGCLAIASVCNGFGPTQRAIYVIYSSLVLLHPPKPSYDLESFLD